MPGKAFRLMWLGMLLAGLSGCSEGWLLIEEKGEYPQETVPQVRQMTTSFQEMLADGYRRRAKTEDYEHDFVERDYNLSKVNLLEQGGMVEPESLGYRRLPAHAVNDLTAARARLQWVLGQGMAHHLPQAMARAQVNFDCWMEEQEENRQIHDVEACRFGFEAAMAELERQLPGAGPGLAADDGCGCCSCLPPSPYIVYFDFDKSDLTAEARMTLDRVLLARQTLAPSRIVLLGHADRSGKDKYNEGLSRRRVDMVGSALRSAGVPERQLIRQYYGENLRRVETRDGVRNAENRRVEIIFNWQ